MTLDGAIKRAEEVAEKNKEDFRLCPSQECDGTQDCRCLKNGEGKGCLRCAAEYRQLADWLNELKWLREKIQSQTEPFNPCIICQEFDCSGCKFKR